MTGNKTANIKRDEMKVKAKILIENLEKIALKKRIELTKQKKY